MSVTGTALRMAQRSARIPKVNHPNEGNSNFRIETKSVLIIKKAKMRV